MAKIYGNTLATTMNPNRFQGGNGGSGGGITKEEVVSLIDDSHSAVVFPRFRAIEAEVETKATNDLSNVSNEDFLSKLNEVLPDGDEVSY